MSDKYENGKYDEIEEFLNEFDKIADGFEKRLNQRGGDNMSVSAGNKTEYAKSAGDDMAKKKPSNNRIKPKEKKKRKYRLNIKRFLLTILVFTVIVFCGVAGWAASVIAGTPAIDAGNLYSMLAENSILYDDKGNEIESIHSGGTGLRTNLDYTQMPQNLINAFIAIEDKTFRTHSGFNVIRIFGAIFEGIVTGDSIKGTSTITQQLARNLYIEDKSRRTMKRKVKEAYYAVLLERQLSKPQIVEAYLNTIYLGSGVYGVQAASQAYFSKDVDDLSIAECAVLASIPKSPLKYSPIKRLNNEDIEDPGSLDFIYRGDSFSIWYQPEFVDRQKLVLKFMKEQGKVTQDQYEEALAENIRDSINPNINAASDISSYFADYVIRQVTEGLMREYSIDEDEARNIIYNGGLRIHSTMNVDMQKIIEKEFKNNNNFPTVSRLKKDKKGNVLDSSGKILLYHRPNIIDKNDDFVLSSEEYRIDDKGNLVLLPGFRLNFYKTETQGKSDYKIEFKPMYEVLDNIFYSIPGGYLLIPSEYKTKDEKGNLIIDREYFSENIDKDPSPKFGKGYYQLREKVVQPQSAMVVLDYKTGGIKAMAGGRSLSGKLLFNRATATRQPGSAIKPLAVYGPALQRSAEMVQGDTDTDNMKLWTAASIIDDSPHVVQGKLWPKNWYPGYRGLNTLRQSVEQSINVNAVKVFTDIGPATSLAFLKKMGITSVVESGNVNDMNAAALALGGMTKGISPLQMAAAYGTFPNKGMYAEPISYTKVTDKRGDVLLEGTSSKKQVMDQGIAFIMTDILSTTVTSGIAGPAAIGSHPVAGKTGTTSDNYDAWFVGTTPYYSAALWIGNDINLELSSGSTSAARLWSRIMKQIHSGMSAASFPVAENVSSIAIDTKSGKLPSELSSSDPRKTVRNEYFLTGTSPVETDDIHVSATICAESGYLATPYCPNQQSKVMIQRPKGSVTSYGNAVVGDIEYEVPNYYCNRHNPDPVSYPISPNEELTFIDNWDNDDENEISFDE